MATGLDIHLWERRLPGHARDSPIGECLREEGHRVTLQSDRREAWPSSGVFWLQANAAWYPDVRRRIAAFPRALRPPVLIWNSEPLPPPRSAGLPWPCLHLREIAKIALRDVSATILGYPPYDALHVAPDTEVPVPL